VSPHGGSSPLEIWLAAAVLCLSTVALLLGSAPLSTLGVIGTAISFGVDQLLDRPGLVDRDALQATADSGVGRDLAMLPLGVVAEDSMGCGSQPCIRLAGLRDVVGFVQEAGRGGLAHARR